MGEIADYGPLLPTKAPDGAIEYCKQHCKGLQRHYLIYRADWVQMINDSGDGFKQQKIVKGVCSSCGGTMHAQWILGAGCSAAWQRAPFGFLHPMTDEKIVSWDHCLCPICGAEVQAIHIGSISTHTSRIMDQDYCITADVCEGKPVLLGWFVYKYTDKDGHTAYDSSPCEGCVIDGKKIYRVSGAYRGMFTVSRNSYWEQRKKWQDEWGNRGAVIPFEPDIFAGTELENSKIDLYIAACETAAIPCNPISYARLYQKHPQVENLVQQGAGAIVAEKIEDYRQQNSVYGTKKCYIPQLEGVDWKKKRPAQMLGLNKIEFEICKCFGCNAETLEAYKMLRDIEPVNMRQDLPVITACGAKTARTLANNTELRRDVKVMRCLRYLRKQRETVKRKTDGRYLLDYWQMCIDINENIDDPAVRFPKDLAIAHDRVVKERDEQQERIAAEKKKAEIEARRAGFAATADNMSRFEWECDGIIIRPCADEYELIAEGKALNHCVATYAGRISRGETAIFFIRKENEPDKPWYTLELDPQKLEVRQNRGKGNRARTEDVQAFEAKWLEHIRSAAVKRNKKESAV